VAVRHGSATSETVWRYLLTDASRTGLTATRTVLGQLLDGLARSGGPVDAPLQRVVSSFLTDREAGRTHDWRYYLVKYPAMREGATGIYFGVDGELGYSTCMLRTKQLNGKYRDPILLELWRSSGADENVEDPWFTGYETLPRWLRLIRSGIGIRSVADGFALQPPEDVRLAAIFRDVWRRRDDVVVVEDNVMLLKIPQDDAGDGPVDTVDRVAVGAAFLRELVDAGL